MTCVHERNKSVLHNFVAVKRKLMIKHKHELYCIQWTNPRDKTKRKRCKEGYFLKSNRKFTNDHTKKVELKKIRKITRYIHSLNLFVAQSFFKGAKVKHFKLCKPVFFFIIYEKLKMNYMNFYVFLGEDRHLTY